MKIPTPRRLPSGSYFVRLRLGGEDICITRPTAKECRIDAEFIKAEHRAGKRKAPVKAGDMTLKDTVEAYVEKHKAILSPSTYRAYDIYKDSRFRAYQDKKLDDIDWQQMINDELRIVKPKTVKNGWGLVHASLDFAGYPAPKVKLAQVPVNEIPFLQPDEILPFCKAVKGARVEIAALLELHGLRMSEVRGLPWDKVDLKRDVITVCGAVVRGKDSDVAKKTNKNATSTRHVPIMIPQLHDALNAVSNKTGSVVDLPAQTMLNGVKSACKRAGVTEVGNHGLRHSFASLCYHCGISERQLMSWGGWADFAVMHKRYIRLAAADESAARDKLTEFFKNGNKMATRAQDALK